MFDSILFVDNYDQHNSMLPQNQVLKTHELFVNIIHQFNFYNFQLHNLCNLSNNIHILILHFHKNIKYAISISASIYIFISSLRK